jgi:RNA polymerase sigma-70 factor (ECF subfamily)
MPVLQAESKPQNERIDWLYDEISKLNEIDRSLCLLLLDDFSYRDMADILGVSESNVAIKIHRIKKYLIEQSKKSQHYEI